MKFFLPLLFIHSLTASASLSHNVPSLQKLTMEKLMQEKPHVMVGFPSLGNWDTSSNELMAYILGVFISAPNSKLLTCVVNSHHGHQYAISKPNLLSLFQNLMETDEGNQLALFLNSILDFDILQKELSFHLHLYFVKLRKDYSKERKE